MIIDNSCTIVIIDTNKEWRDFAIRTIQALGIMVYYSDKLNYQHNSVSLPINCLQIVFVDLSIAEKNPDKFRNFVTQKNRYVVVFFSSGYSPCRIRDVFKMGVYDCIEKPYDSVSLIKIIKDIIEEVCIKDNDKYSLAIA